MDKEIEIPEGYEARIEGKNVIIERKENEDEGIRKDLITFICQFAPEHLKVKYVAYLEKQKEQKFTHREADESLQSAVTHQMEDDGDVDDFVRRGIDDIVLKYAKLGAQWQKEQKSNLELIKQSWYSEGYTDGKYKMEPMWNIKTGKGGPKYEKNEKYGQPLEQKPAEWSEEDEHCMHRLILFCENCMQQDSEAIRCATWLKSLRPQPHWKPSEIQMKYLDIAIVEADGHKSYNLAYGLEKLKDNLKKL